MKNQNTALKIIGILIILIPLIDLIFNQHYKDFNKGYNDTNADMNTEFIDVEAKSNLDFKNQFPNINGEVFMYKAELEIQTNEALEIYPFYIWGIYVIIGFLNIVNLVSLVRLVKRFIRGRLLEHSTYTTLLYYGFSCIGASIIIGIKDYIKLTCFIKYLEGSNYEVSFGNLVDTNYIFVGLLTLAFALAIKQSLRMKEENDLTI